MNRAFPRLCAVAALSLSLGACINLAPDYERPELPAPHAWPEGPSYRDSASAHPGETPIADLGWRDFIADESLRQVIEIALENNRDLRIATLNIEKTRAMYQIQRAQLFPHVDLQGSGTHLRTPASLSTTGEMTISHAYAANIGVSSYEADLFGSLRNQSEAAQEQFLASEEARRTAQISLVAQVANTWLLLAADRERLQLAQATFKSQQDSYRLMKQSFDLGTASALDLRQVQTSVEAARVDVANFQSQVAMDQNALDLLVGAPLPPELRAGESLQAVTALSELTADIPSEVLRRRPDILSAEHLLKGANANIGAARANFFPRIFLTGNAGAASAALSQLFKAGAGAWSFIPAITMPLFDAGANTARLEAARADEKIAVANYEKAIQIAFREVADALADYGTIDERLAAQRSLEEATSESYRLTEARFRAGADSYFNVLVMQRAMYNAQQTLIGARLAKESNLIMLYKVLGGGWQEYSTTPEELAARQAGEEGAP
ncbi:MAG: efflux transporter outer membrane subunit [Betaproteobacteria bacterium]|nr:efflux transporter outer membrane subunit [Betaproteobacteria bacterium]